jgi:NAD(P)H dehydrogenase (quinone)
MAEGQAGKVYELAGDTSYTLAEFAAEIARQSGKPVGYKNLPERDFSAALVAAGLPEGFAAVLADSDAGASKGALFDDGQQLSQLIGHATTPLSAVIGAAL